MKRKNKKRTQPALAQIRHVAKLAVNARGEFNSGPLTWFSKFERDKIITALDKLAGLCRAPNYNKDVAALSDVFGISRDRHSFLAIDLDWAVRLKEPQVTKTLVRLLDMGDPAIRAERIYAFLHALGVKELSSDRGEYEKVIIESEYEVKKSGRIDILFQEVPRVEGKQPTAVIIEAKFTHKITKGQLKRYRDAVNNATCILLALDERAKQGLKGRQNKIWSFVAWRDLWLRFEKARPDEDFPSLEILMKTLWGRIGGLNPEEIK